MLGVKVMMVYLVVFVFIVFDVATGVLKGIYNGKVNSSCLRKGMVRKFTEMLTLFGCNLLQEGIYYFDFGFSPTLLVPMGVYICTMEMVSIIENICEIIPDFKTFFEPYLEKLKDKDK